MTSRQRLVILGSTGSVGTSTLDVVARHPDVALASPVLELGTLAANLIGGYLIGLCIAVFQSMPQLDPVWRLLLVTGFLGGLTTFSTFSAEVVSYLMAERYGQALGIALMHVLGSLLMTLAGLKTAMFFIATCA